jgi:hypothetical protein
VWPWDCAAMPIFLVSYRFISVGWAFFHSGVGWFISRDELPSAKRSPHAKAANDFYGDSHSFPFEI